LAITAWRQKNVDYKYEILEKSIVYRGFFQMEKYRLQHRLFCGDWSPPIIRECLERGHAVAVLPYDPVRDQVVLVEQFRIGALQTQDHPWLLEIVAGIIDSDEHKLDVARRETREEAGCELLDILPICEYLISPGGTSETIALYCGRIDAAQVHGLQGVAEEHEDIRVHVLPRNEVKSLLNKGVIRSATTIIALQWLELQHSELLKQWQPDLSF
jgi:ADP-ribose pyrophosphatase